MEQMRNNRSVLLQSATHVLLPLLLLFSLILLFRGYHAPGGGFSAALVLAAGFALDFMTYGVLRGRRALILSPLALAAAGLALAAASGLLPLLLGKPLFTALWMSTGPVEFGTPLLFEFGIYLIVAGSALLMIFSLAKK